MNNKNFIETDPYGKAKENAWMWLLKSYWAPILGQLFVLIPGWYIGITDSIEVLYFVAPINIAIVSICVYYGIKQYKELTERKLIKEFKDSKFISKY